MKSAKTTTAALAALASLLLSSTGFAQTVPSTVSGENELWWAFPDRAWNGETVFLSAPTHADAGERGECRDENENWMNIYNAINAADNMDRSYAFDLASRGYMTYVAYHPTAVPYGKYPSQAVDHWAQQGRYDLIGFAENVRMSRLVQPDVYITMHSNALSQQVSNPTAAQCSNVPFANSMGTRVYHNPNLPAAASLSRHLNDSVGPYSPGARDNLFNANNAFYEVREVTNIPMAYLESEFHVWNPGIDFLVASNWQDSIGQAVDRQLNYPR